MKLSTSHLIKSSLFAVSVGLMASVFPSSTFAFTVTGRAIPGLIQGLSAEENFAAEGFTLIAESEKEVTLT